MSRINMREELEDIYTGNCTTGNKVSISNKMFDDVINLVKKHSYITLQDLFIEPEMYNYFSARKFFNVVSYLDSYLGKNLEFSREEGRYKTFANIFYKGTIYTFEMYFLSGTEAVMRVNFDATTGTVPCVTIKEIDEDFHFIGV